MVNDAQIGSHLVEVLFDHATDEALADIYTSYFAGSAGTLDFLDCLAFLRPKNFLGGLRWATI